MNTGPEYVKPAEASEADKLAADELKNKGNDAMKNLTFTEALDHYNKYGLFLAFITILDNLKNL